MIVRELLFELGFNSVHAERNAKRMDRIVGKLKLNLVRLGAAAVTAAIGLGAAAVKAGNDYQAMSNKLKLVTENLNELKAAQQGVFDIAQRARTSLEASTDLYFGMAKAAEQYGFSQERILRITETTAKLATLASNKDPAGTNAALFQLRQGIMSGQLRGQELNSVLEQATPVADAIARGMGIPFAEIRKLAEKGEITGIAVLKALESQAAITDEEFSKMDRTATQAKQQLKNAFGFFAGKIAEDGDAIQAQIDFYDAVREIIESPGFKDSLVFALKTLTLIIKAVSELIKIFGKLINALGGLDGIVRTVTSALMALATFAIAKAIVGIIAMITHFGFAATAAWYFHGALTAMTGLMGLLSLPVLAVLAGFTALFLVFEDLYNFIQGNDSVIGDLINRWSDFGRIISDALTSPLLPIQRLYNSIVKLLQLVGKAENVELLNFSDALYNKFNGFQGSVDAQYKNAVAIQAQRRAGAVNQQITMQNNNTITVPAGTNKEQAEYISAEVMRAQHAAENRMLREARNNFTEVE
jgi:tape measure domain-containing protein